MTPDAEKKTEKRKQETAILFSDIKGFSKITDDALIEKINHTINELKPLFTKHHDFLYLNTWGDAFYVVFSTCSGLLEQAVKLRDAFITADWTGEGFPDQVKVRIALHHGEAAIISENGNITNVVGTTVITGARIEPVVEPNTIFCSSAFHETVKSRTKRKFFPLQELELAKGFGSLELYSIGTQARVAPRKKERQVKILSITASPDSTIQYEQEQAVLLDSFGPYLGDNLIHDMPDPIQSTLTEMDKYLGQYPYDILIISAHGSPGGELLFEDGEGKEVRVRGREIAEKLKKLSRRPFVVILSSCHSAKEETSLLSPAQEIVDRGGVAAVVGMAKAITHEAAIDFNRGFIQSVLAGMPIDYAFSHAQEEIKKGETMRCQDRAGKWTSMDEDLIPRLLINKRRKKVTRERFHPRIIKRERLISADFEGAKYVERGFIGRRDELRGVMKRALIEKQGVIVIKGPGGVGKSALTTRVCANLKNEGWELLIHVGRVRVHEIMGKIFTLAKKRGVQAVTMMENDPSLPWQEKLRRIIKEFLASQKTAIILDNFEDNQDPETGDPGHELGEFIHLCRFLNNHESALFITTRYRLPGIRPAVELGDLSRVEMHKLFAGFKTLSRIGTREITSIHHGIGANPRALKLLEGLSEEIFGNREFEADILEGLINEAATVVTGDRVTQRDFSPWFLEKLISYLDDKERDLLKTLSLYRRPVKSKGLFLSRGKVVKLAQNPQRLSLLTYLPVDTYLCHRLTAGYVVTTLFTPEELRERRREAGRYLEKVNLLEAVYQYRESGEFDRAFEIANNVQNDMVNHGYVYEARELLEGFLEVELGPNNRGVLCHSYGIIEHRQGKYESALAYYKESLAINEKLEDIAGEAFTIAQIGLLNMEQEKYQHAFDCFRKAYLVFKKLGSPSAKHAAEYIQQVKEHIPPDEFRSKLAESGIEM